MYGLERCYSAILANVEFGVERVRGESTVHYYFGGRVVEPSGHLLGAMADHPAWWPLRVGRFLSNHMGSRGDFVWHHRVDFLVSIIQGLAYAKRHGLRARPRIWFLALRTLKFLMPRPQRTIATELWSIRQIKARILRYGLYSRDHGVGFEFLPWILYSISGAGKTFHVDHSSQQGLVDADTLIYYIWAMLTKKFGEFWKGRPADRTASRAIINDALRTAMTEEFLRRWGTDDPVRAFYTVVHGDNLTFPDEEDRSLVFMPTFEDVSAYREAKKLIPGNNQPKEISPEEYDADKAKLSRVAGPRGFFPSLAIPEEMMPDPLSLYLNLRYSDGNHTNYFRSRQ